METAAALVRKLAGRVPGIREQAGIMALFASTLFLSALLLFSVQPMFARIVLPKLGGSPSVWAVSMCFFQTVLLAGYCYAHLLNRFASLRTAPLIHFLVLALAVAALPIGLPSNLAEPEAGAAYGWLVATLAVGVGLPFFAVSASAPLLQSWFSRSGHPHAADPYFLYGASNLGSLAALLAYPVLIEPFAGLASQSAMWSTGFVALGLCIAGCAFAVVRAVAPTEAVAMSAAVPAATPTNTERAAWVGLAAVPSGLLVSFSTYLTTDIASAPFLWVIPLAVFLATFILVFRDPPSVRHEVLLRLQPLLVVCALLGLMTLAGRDWLVSCLCGFSAFFVTTMVAHRELYQRRPGKEHLTEFYLWMSLGGVIGGMFAALLAPQVFNTLWEYPIFLVLGMFCRPGVLAGLGNRDELRRLAVAVLAGVVLIVAMKRFLTDADGDGSRLLHLAILLAAMVGLVWAWGRSAREALLAGLMTLGVTMLPNTLNAGDADRSFFGVLHVRVVDGMRLLIHGTTVHGAERLDAHGRPLERPVPATYYHPEGPMGRGFAVARAATGKMESGLAVGIVGLGAGSLACYSRPGETWRFYEIDPLVVKIASDPARFSYLSKCRPGADIVTGDARLTLAKEADGKFDYLVIDAFSSDAIPVHLITAEALQLYASKLSAGGVLAMHISNRHLDLAPVVASLVRTVPGATAHLVMDMQPAGTQDHTSSHVVFMTRTEAATQLVAALPKAKPLVDTGLVPWTDDYSNILSAIWRKYRAK